MNKWLIGVLCAASVVAGIAQSRRQLIVQKPSSGLNYNAITNSMVAYWKMEEFNANRVDSFDGNVLTQMVDNISSTTGIIGASPDFSSSSYVANLSINDNAALSFSNQDLTLTLWFKLTDTNRTSTLVAKSSSTVEYAVFWSLGILTFYAGNGLTTYTNVDASTTFAQNAWYFVCCQHDASGQTVTIAINGGTAVSKSYSNGLGDGVNPFTVGIYTGGPDSYIPRGTLDEVAIWKRKLTAAEITAIYNAGTGRTCCPFVE